MLQLSSVDNGYAVSAMEFGVVRPLASHDWEDTARPPRTAIIASSESGWVTLPLCLTQAEKDYAAGVATGEVSFVLEWETKGAMASDWDEVGEEASHGDEQEDGEEKGEREEEPHEEEEATGTREKRRNKEVRKKRKKGKGMEKREIKKNKGKGNE
jgi:hypothetical protein